MEDFMSSNALLDHFAVAFCDTWNVGDVDGAMELYAQDVIYRDFSTRGNIEGFDNVRTFVEKYFARWDTAWTVLDVQPFADTEGGIIFWEINGGYRGRDERITGYGLDHIRLRDGLICVDDVYFDSRQLSPLGKF